jgi:hypothetical protein
MKQFIAHRHMVSMEHEFASWSELCTAKMLFTLVVNSDDDMDSADA